MNAMNAMNASTRERKVTAALQYLARALLMIGWAVGQIPAGDPARAVAQPAGISALAPPQACADALPEAAASVPAEDAVLVIKPSRCGDLPRAPWNTCVALDDHEI